MQLTSIFFENVAQLRFLGTTETTFQELLLSRLLPKNAKVRIYKIIILPVALYCCITWPLTVREVLRLRVFENKMLRRIIGRKRDEVTGKLEETAFLAASYSCWFTLDSQPCAPAHMSEMLYPRLAYSSNLRMETAHFSETPLNFYEPTCVTF
jgi:hypothetical protein